jgi:hypothetical protein
MGIKEYDHVNNGHNTVVHTGPRWLNELGIWITRSNHQNLKHENVYQSIKIRVFTVCTTDLI